MPGVDREEEAACDKHQTRSEDVHTLLNDLAAARSYLRLIERNFERAPSTEWLRGDFAEVSSAVQHAHEVAIRLARDLPEEAR